MIAPSLPLVELRALYLSLGSIEELPGERTYIGRCNTWERFLAYGPWCAAVLRRHGGQELHPGLAALLDRAWPASTEDDLPA